MNAKKDDPAQIKYTEFVGWAQSAADSEASALRQHIEGALIPVRFRGGQTRPVHNLEKTWSLEEVWPLKTLLDLARGEEWTLMEISV